MLNSDVIIHICEAQDWLLAQEVGEYRAKSLDSEGFIHCSRPEQILEVANMFYHNFPNLLLLYIDTSQLNAELRWETVTNVEFPHIYGPLNLNAVLSTAKFIPDETGYFRSLPESKL